MAETTLPDNDVWKTIQGVADKVFDYKLESQRIRTRASPSGEVAAGPNPFPGTQSDHPQNDTKKDFGADFSMPGWAIALLVGALVLLVFGLLKR